MAGQYVVGDDGMKVDWQEVPSYFFDGILGNAYVGGMHRIILGEFIFDPDPAATKPNVRPVCNLVLSHDALTALIERLQAVTEIAVDE